MKWNKVLERLTSIFVSIFKSLPIFIMLLVIVILAYMAIEAISKKYDKFTWVYISHGNTLTVLQVGNKIVQIPGFRDMSKMEVVNRFELSVNDMLPASNANLIQPGLDFKIDSRQAQVGDSLITQYYFRQPAIYCIDNSNIKRLKEVYFNYNGITTEYKIINGMFKEKKLSPLELNEIPYDSRSKINKGEILVLGERLLE